MDIHPIWPYYKKLSDRQGQTCCHSTNSPRQKPLRGLSDPIFGKVTHQSAGTTSGRLGRLIGLFA